jgi:hypothetical protein
MILVDLVRLLVVIEKNQASERGLMSEESDGRNEKERWLMVDDRWNGEGENGVTHCHKGSSILSTLQSHPNPFVVPSLLLSCHRLYHLHKPLGSFLHMYPMWGMWGREYGIAVGGGDLGLRKRRIG